MMRPVTMYESNDGRQFSTESASSEWDTVLSDTDEANRILNSGQSLKIVVDAAYRNTRGRHHINGEDVLAEMTKDSGIAIPHWQCREEAGYKLQRMQPDGQLYVYGNVGSWSGGYGGYMSLEDFIRYAEDTKRKGLLK